MRNSIASHRRNNLFSALDELVEGVSLGLLLLVALGMLVLTYSIFQMSFRYRDYSVPIGLSLVVLLVLAVIYIAKHWSRSTLANLSKHYKQGKMGSVINMEQFMSPSRLPVNPFAGRKYQPFYDAVVGRVKGSTTRKTSLTEKRAKARTLNKFPYND